MKHVADKFKDAYELCKTESDYEILCRVFSVYERIKYKKMKDLELNEEEADLYERIVEGSTIVKRCARCGEYKPVSEFRWKEGSLDWHNCYCHKCEVEKTREYRHRQIFRHQKFT